MACSPVSDFGVRIPSRPGRFIINLRHSPVAVPRRFAKLAVRRTYSRSLLAVPSRAELPEVLNRRRLLGTGVEVGVKDGEFSEVILHGWRGRLLISVDAWSVACEEDPAQPRVNQAEHDRHYANACNRLAPFGERSEVWRCESTAAAAQLPPRSLDFVYIDARHDYEAVAADIAAWIDRVRPGGLFAGHDYFDGQYQGAFYGVKRAVDEFCADRGLRVATTWREPVEMRSWLVLMPER